MKIQTIQRAGGRTVYRFTLSLGRNAHGRRVQRAYTYDTLEQAEAERARLTGQLPDAASADPRRVTVAQALDAYLETACYGLAEGTKVSYRSALLPARERLGGRKLQSITRRDIEQLRDWLLATGRRRGGTPGTGLGPRSVHLTMSRLRAALEQQVADGVIARNPARYVKMPAQGRRAGTTWSPGELRAFLEVAGGDRLACAWRLSLLGMRRGEVLGLQWSDVDLDAGTVSIGRARVQVYGRALVKAPKSERGYRVLPVDGELAGVLRAQHARQAGERLAAGAAWEAGPGGGWVACDELGAPLTPDSYTREFHRLCEVAGVPRIRLHDVRHTANSLMAAAGVPDHVRAAWCGHTIAVNVGTYCHARPEDLAVASTVLAGILAGGDSV